MLRRVPDQENMPFDGFTVGLRSDTARRESEQACRGLTSLSQTTSVRSIYGSMMNSFADIAYSGQQYLCLLRAQAQWAHHL